MTIRARLAAFRELTGNPAPEDCKFALTDADALALADEIADEFTPRHPEAFAAARARFVQAGPQPADPEAVIEWAGKVKAAREAFWDAFEGEVIDGVTVIRRR
jgi:hypothetical protein